MEDIKSTCEKYGITNYTINEDRSIDVDGDIDLADFEELSGKKITFCFEK